MDAEDIQEAFSDLGLSSIASGSPAEVPADGSNTAGSNDAEGFVAPVAEPANINRFNPVATNTNNTGSRAATTIVAPDPTNQPARHRTAANPPARKESRAAAVAKRDAISSKNLKRPLRETRARYA